MRIDRYRAAPPSFFAPLRGLFFALPVVAAALFAVAPAFAQRSKGRPAPSAAAERCGAALEWKDALDAALDEARKTGKPVFWYVATTPQSPMDRKVELDFYARSGMFSMPDVVSLLAHRTVPLKLAAPTRRARRTDAPPTEDPAAAFKKYDLKVGDFVEPGFVLLKPDGTAFFKLDRVSTFHELWLTALLDRELKKAGFDVPKAEADELASEKLPPLDKVARMLALGAPAGALGSLEKFEGAQAIADGDKERAALLRGEALSRLGQADAAEKALAAAGSGPAAAVERGLLALRREDEAKAAEILAAVPDGPRSDEARLYLGCALWRLGRRAEATATWKKLAADKPKSPSAWKAAAEADGFGAFVRGFEEFGYLRDDALADAPEGTERPRTEQDADWLARRGVAYLLKMQGPDGGFEDSIYDFGGRDTLPDVYVAVTAIAARALLQWRTLDAPKIDAAVTKALDYCADERRCSAKNTQERMWAHSYRILLLRDALAAGCGDPAKNKAKLQEIVKLVEGIQMQKGAWFHEYPNPFVTALALQSLAEAKRSGAKIDPAKFEAGARALATTRGDDGNFSYGFPGKGDRDDAFAAGRNPQLEYALKLAGMSDDAKVAAAVEKSFRLHDAYEATRKYDNHAPPHQIGGFFFFYDEMHRADAILSLADPAKRRGFLAEQRALLLKIPEIDGRFVDSHELGKAYGAAAGLLCLKATTPPAQ